MAKEEIILYTVLDPTADPRVVIPMRLRTRNRGIVEIDDKENLVIRVGDNVFTVKMLSRKDGVVTLALVPSEEVRKNVLHGTVHTKVDLTRGLSM